MFFFIPMPYVFFHMVTIVPNVMRSRTMTRDSYPAKVGTGIHSNKGVPDSTCDVCQAGQSLSEATETHGTRNFHHLQSIQNKSSN